MSTAYLFSLFSSTSTMLRYQIWFGLITLVEGHFWKKGIFLEANKWLGLLTIFQIIRSPYCQIHSLNELNGQASDDHTLGLWNSLQLVYIRDSNSEKKIHEHQSHYHYKYEEKRLGNKSCFFVFDKRVCEVKFTHQHCTDFDKRIIKLHEGWCSW